MDEQEYKELLEKYKSKIREGFGERPASQVKVTSKEYLEFKEEFYPKRYSWFEKACNTSEHILKLKADAAKAALMQKNLDLCHLNITPSGVLCFAVLASLGVIITGSLISLGIPFLLGKEPMFFFVIFSFV